MDNKTYVSIDQRRHHAQIAGVQLRHFRRIRFRRHVDGGDFAGRVDFDAGGHRRALVIDDDATGAHNQRRHVSIFSFKQKSGCNVYCLF